MVRYCLLTATLSCLSFFALASPPPIDTITRNSLLYNGFEYTKNVNYFNEWPFFQGSDFLPGQVSYTGNTYAGVHLQYDCVEDLVILKDPLRERRVVLVKEKVDGFSIGKHQFVRLNWLGPKGEFFEQLYKGKRSVLVQWKKNLVRDLALQEHYVLVKTIYLLDGKQLVKITKPSELTRLMGDKRKKVQQYYREANLSFRNDPEAAAAKIVEKGEEAGW